MLLLYSKNLKTLAKCKAFHFFEKNSVICNTSSSELNGKKYEVVLKLYSGALQKNPN